MSKKQDKAPNRGNLLFKNLFGKCQRDTSFERIADGLYASRRNAERLLSDVRFLVEAGRLSSARFLLTTSQEELAKSYILVEMCRLDLEKHESVLRRLCCAFYDHISKHAYLKILDFPNINSMDNAKAIWEIEVQRWQPGDYESGEPDMPHHTYFDREFPLYIDYSDYDGCWLVPTDTDQNAYLMGMLWTEETPITKTEKFIELWKKADSIGICSPVALQTLNDVFKKHYIQGGTTREHLEHLYDKVAKGIKGKADISLESFMASPLAQWPLYHLV